MFQKIPMTFTELQRRLDRSSDNDRMYERPMDWTEAEELLMIYEQTRMEVERLEKKIHDAKSLGDWKYEFRR